jgi:hypothetical protein
MFDIARSLSSKRFTSIQSNTGKNGDWRRDPKTDAFALSRWYSSPFSQPLRNCSPLILGYSAPTGLAVNVSPTPELTLNANELPDYRLLNAMTENAGNPLEAGWLLLEHERSHAMKEDGAVIPVRQTRSDRNTLLCGVAQ